jgi:hypothetical protein
VSHPKGAVHSFFDFSSPRNRNINRNTNRYTRFDAGENPQKRAPAARGPAFRCAIGVRMAGGDAPAPRTSVDSNFKEQGIGSGSGLSSQWTVSRETVHLDVRREAELR